MNLAALPNILPAIPPTLPAAALPPTLNIPPALPSNPLPLLNKLAPLPSILPAVLATLDTTFLTPGIFIRFLPTLCAIFFAKLRAFLIIFLANFATFLNIIFAIRKVLFMLATIALNIFSPTIFHTRNPLMREFK